jgi:hypothetical protein
MVCAGPEINRGEILIHEIIRQWHGKSNQLLVNGLAETSSQDPGKVFLAQLRIAFFIALTECFQPGD